MHSSIFHSSLRIFFMSVCTILGIFVGFFAIGAILGLIESADTLPPSKFVADVQPNALGSRKLLSKSAPVVLKINIHGTIGSEELNSSLVNEMLIESRENTLKNDRVKAIMLSINTPGGTVTDADGIYRNLLEYKKRYNVPVYAYVDGLCASGGMYIVSAADKIYATDTSLIGSVGVISGPFMNASKFIEKLGIEALTLSEGLGKDNLDPLRPWSANEAKPMKEIINYYYNSFVDIVSNARPKLTREKLINEYGAHIFPASIAEGYGYIDYANASYEVALTDLLKKIGIEDDYYQVVELNRNAWSSLFRAETSPLFGKIRHTFDLPYELRPELMNRYLYLYRP